MDGLFTRDGHLSELTINRLVCGELDGVAALDAHLNECALCREAVAAARAFDAQVTLRPPTGSVENTRSGRLPLYATMVAMAAAIAFVVLRADISSETVRPPAEEFRLKGGFDFQVYAHDGHTSRAVDSGGAVHPGERLGFQFGAKGTGHLMVVGTDGHGKPYLCYPQDNQGRSKKTIDSPAARDLEEAVRLDDVLGVEAIIALHCDAPLNFKEAAVALEGVPADADVLPTVRPDCTQRVIRLSKVTRNTP